MQINNEIIQDYIDRRLIRMQRHPELDLRILNYTINTQWNCLWDSVTLKCRGLVVDGDGNIVARCLPKFFNVGELPALGIEVPNESFSVFEKEDGSLIQLFRYKNQWVICSKGSFTSDHVGWAWNIIKSKHQKALDILVANDVFLNHTFVFELIVPQGRIVRDYGGKEELILLTIINNKTGKEITTIFDDGRDHFIGFPLVKQYNGITDYGVLAKMVADDHEGFVVRFSNGFRMKIKGEEYIRLHKAITNLNSNDVWDAYCARMPFEKFIEPFPDEMFDWINKIWNEIEDKLNILFEEVSTEYWRLNREILVKRNMSDKQIVELFKSSNISFSLLMSYHVGRINLVVESLLMKCKPTLQKCWMQ